MTETIESFIDKLQVEGIQAGEKAAQELIDKAEQKANTIIGQAEGEANKIKSSATKEADEMLSRAKGELDLAVRDTLLKLHEVVNAALKKILGRASETALHDTDFLKSIIGDLVMQYCKAETGQNDSCKLNLTPEKYEDLSEWTKNELGRTDDGRGLNIYLGKELEQAGFEISVTDGTIEITRESITAVLAELVGPGIRELLSGK